MDKRTRIDERIIEDFEEMTKNADGVQSETLKKILEESGNTEYLHKYLGLHGSTTDPAIFKASVPVISYDDVEPYIQRIVSGESSLILTGTPVTALTISSGTTRGTPKTYLFNDEIVNSFLQMNLTSRAFRNREFPHGNGKAFHIFYVSSNQSESKGGLPVGVVSTNIFRALQNQNRIGELWFAQCTPDDITSSGHDFEQTLYCHLLSALVFREQVQLVSSTFARNIVHAFRTFEHVWEELCSDIQQGVLSSRVSSVSARATMSNLVLPEPNPELADLISKTCVGLVKDNWYSTIPQLFPNAKYIHAIMTGSMQPYSDKLRYYAGELLPLVSGDYGATEGFIGTNMNPKLPPQSVSFTIIPNSAYYEFIPIGKENSGFTNKEPVGLTQVEVGQEYEIVITNSAGLYRYRLGDVVKITGFHNSAPQFQFVGRGNVMLSVNQDKTTDNELQQVVQKASKLLADEKIEVVDYTSRVESGHYVIIWELSGEASDGILKECCDVLDGSFGDTNYVSSRKTNDIGALELRVVRSGTLQKVAAHYIGQGASLSQFKMPRCMVSTSDAVLQILSSNVVGIYFSTIYS